MGRNACRRFPFGTDDGGIDGFRIGIGIRRDQIEVIEDRRVRFRFNAFRAHFTAVFKPPGRAVVGRDVALRQIVQREGH